MSADHLDIAAIAHMLAERIDRLAPELLPGGRRVQGHMWRVGSLAGEPGQSLCIYMVGARAGKWRDFASAEASGDWGDALDLVAKVLYRGDKRQAILWARGWLGLGPGGGIDEATRERLRRRAEARERQLARQQRHRQIDAQRIWLAAKPLQPGDPAWRYLAGRGIDIAKLRSAKGEGLRALRCHPGLAHPEGGTWPALVALVTGPDGRGAAIHRTWLAPRNLACEPRPMVGKAPVEPAKMTLGNAAGGLIRLWRGASKKPWREAPAERLILSEGIEDLLSYVPFDPAPRAACALSLSMMLLLDLPPAFEEIGILGQNDQKGSAAARLLDRVVERFQDEGRRVFVWRPPGFVKDANDWVRHLAVSA